ncbi:hypothetical protein KY362_04035, partial [Candidatus Woesearchaeota archaeon]|nr:hypothetical protein [Candidatus Woesearchaeota archaeon]
YRSDNPFIVSGNFGTEDTGSGAGGYTPETDPAPEEPAPEETGSPDLPTKRGLDIERLSRIVRQSITDNNMQEALAREGFERSGPPGKVAVMGHISDVFVSTRTGRYVMQDDRGEWMIYAAPSKTNPDFDTDFGAPSEAYDGDPYRNNSLIPVGVKGIEDNWMYSYRYSYIDHFGNQVSFYSQRPSLTEDATIRAFCIMPTARPTGLRCFVDDTCEENPSLRRYEASSKRRQPADLAYRTCPSKRD